MLDLDPSAVICTPFFQKKRIEKCVVSDQTLNNQLINNNQSVALSAPVFDQDQIQTGVVEAEFSMQDYGVVESVKSVVEGNQQKDTPATNQPIVQQPQVNSRCGR